MFGVITLFNILKFSGKELIEGPKYVAIAGEQASVVGWWLFLILYSFLLSLFYAIYWTLTNPFAKVEIWDVNTAERIAQLPHSSGSPSNQIPNQRGFFFFFVKYFRKLLLKTSFLRSYCVLDKFEIVYFLEGMLNFKILWDLFTAFPYCGISGCWWI